MNRSRLAAVAAVTCTSVLWGTTGTAATLAPGAGPLAIGAAALGVGGLLQAAVAVRALWQARCALRRHIGLLAVGALAVLVYPLAFYSSMDLAGVAVGSVVSLASGPLASGVLERFLNHRVLGPRWSLAAALGIAGSVLLSLATIRAPAGGAPVPGIVLGLLAGLSYATFSWAVRELMQRQVARGAAMGAVFGTGGLLLMPVLLLTGAPLLASQQAFLVAGYIALVPMFLGYVLFGFGLLRLPASSATTITLTEPALATVLAVLIVGERLTAPGWAALLLIAAVPVLLAMGPGASPQERRSEPSRRSGEAAAHRH